jgi:hypothetical protein
MHVEATNQNPRSIPTAAAKQRARPRSLGLCRKKSRTPEQSDDSRSQENESIEETPQAIPGNPPPIVYTSALVIDIGPLSRPTTLNFLHAQQNTKRTQQLSLEGIAALKQPTI